MSFQNLVRQTSTTTGTGNLAVASTETGWRTMADAFGTGSGNKFRYVIRHQSTQPVEWESGVGYMSNSTTLVRDTVIASSNANAAVSFSSGTKEISADVPAENFSLLGNSDKVGNGSLSPIGYTSIGGSTETPSVNMAFLKQITPPASGTIRNIVFYTAGDAGGHVQSLQVLVYSDNAGAPLRQLMASAIAPMLLESASSTPVARWVTMPINYRVTSGTPIWIGFANYTPVGPGPAYYDGSGSDRTQVSGGAWPADYGRYTTNTTTRKYSIYADLEVHA